MIFAKHKVLICAGTGGVGKTSMSAALGVLAARSGKKTLVLTIDPARRLAQALGLESHRHGEAVPVPDVAFLSACMIDPRQEFDDFVLGSVDSAVAKALFKNKLYQQLVGNLNGSQEFTSLVKLLSAVESEKYDLVILDTPPTQNAVDFLAAPERLYALFQDSVLGWFANVDRKKGFIQRTLHRGTMLVTSALEAVTGSSFIAELKDFFTHILHLRERISRVSAEVGQLMHSQETAFVLVTGFDENKLKEALEFKTDLGRAGLNLSAVIVNRWFPEWGEGEAEWPAAWKDDPEFQKLEAFYAQFRRFFKNRQETFSDFVTKLGSQVPVLKLPDLKNNIQGVADLGLVARMIEDKWTDKK